MTITYSSGNAASQYFTVKTRKISFTNEKEFTLNLVTQVGLTVDYPANWTPNPNWTPTQIAENTPMYAAIFAINISSIGDNKNFGSYYLSSNEPEYNLGRFYLLSGSTTAPLILKQERIRNQRLFLFDGELQTLSYDQAQYNVRLIKLSLNAEASGGITINLPIAL